MLIVARTFRAHINVLNLELGHLNYPSQINYRAK